MASFVVYNDHKHSKQNLQTHVVTFLCTVTLYFINAITIISITIFITDSSIVIVDAIIIIIIVVFIINIITIIITIIVIFFLAVSNFKLLLSVQ